MEIEHLGNAWVAQSIKRPILDSGSGHEKSHRGFIPTFDSVLTAWSLLGILSLCPSILQAHSVPHKINNIKKKKKK